MDALARGDADHLLSELAQQDALARDVRDTRRGRRRCCASRPVAVEAEEQIGRREVEEVQRVRLQDLPVVHQPAHLLGRRRELRRADDEVERLGGGEVVAHRADAAQALHHHRHLPVRAALDEVLEAAELDDVEPHLVHRSFVVEQDRDLAVALDARDRIDRDAAQASRFVGGFEFDVACDDALRQS